MSARSDLLVMDTCPSATREAVILLIDSVLTRGDGEQRPKKLA
jgi:hypothetical protein